MKALILLSVLSCAGAPAAPERLAPKCLTPCGLEADFGPKACGELMAAERAAIDAYALHVPEFKDKAADCRALHGWAVMVHQKIKADKRCDTGDHAWIFGQGWLKDPLCVVGYTYFAAQLIELTDEHAAVNAFAHEIGHVLDHYWKMEAKCNLHTGWKKRGLKAAIQDVTGAPDWSPEDCKN